MLSKTSGFITVTNFDACSLAFARRNYGGGRPKYNQTTSNWREPNWLDGAAIHEYQSVGAMMHACFTCISCSGSWFDFTHRPNQVRGKQHSCNDIHDFCTVVCVVSSSDRNEPITEFQLRCRPAVCLLARGLTTSATTNSAVHSTWQLQPPRRTGNNWDAVSVCTSGGRINDRPFTGALTLINCFIFHRNARMLNLQAISVFW
jgi:hypothetical protein